MLLESSRIGPYEILSPLGEGGMGLCPARVTRSFGRDVAIKVLPDAFANDPDRLLRFQREAQVLASLYHPNIAQIYGLEQSAAIQRSQVPSRTSACRVVDIGNGNYISEPMT